MNKHSISILGSALLKEREGIDCISSYVSESETYEKTFVSQASATMQQYAQRDKKHEYWFAVPQER